MTRLSCHRFRSNKDGGWEYTDSAGESKMEIPVDTVAIVATVADRFAVDRDSRRSRRLSRCCRPPRARRAHRDTRGRMTL